jgi:Bacterial PH domain
VGGWLELRHVRNVRTPTETVLELGQGVWGNDQGLVVLTDERLFFFDKTLMGATIREFPLPAVTSVTVNKKMRGETLAITVAGNVSTITQMMHGQGDALSRAFHQAKAAPASPIVQSPTIIANSSDADEIAKLADLRDRGILTDQESRRRRLKSSAYSGDHQDQHQNQRSCYSYKQECRHMRRSGIGNVGTCREQGAS